MTKKDYELIAQGLRVAQSVADPQPLVHQIYVRALAKRFSVENSRFDEERFIKAATR